MREDPAAAGAELERLLQDLASTGPSSAAAQAQEAVRLLMAFYGAGLSRVLQVVRTEHGGPDAVLRRFAGDPVIAGLLVLHDLHPEPLDVRINGALAALAVHVSPARVTLAGIEEDTVRVVVQGATSGSSARAIRSVIERALQEAAPEIDAIEIEGLVDGGDGLIQITRRHA